MGSNPFTLTQSEATILSLLTATGDAYGLELVEGSEGRLSRGSIYVVLNQLESKGYVRSRKEAAKPGEQGPPRRLYAITSAGSKALTEWATRWESLRARLGLDGFGLSPTA